MRQRRALMVIVMASGALFADAPLAAQRVAERSVASSSGIGGHSALDSFGVNVAALNRSTTTRGELSTVRSRSPSASLEERPDRTEVRGEGAAVIAERSTIDWLIPFEETAPPKYRSSYVLVGGLLGAVIGVGGMGYYVARNCDDCMLSGLYAIGLAGVGGAIVGGITGSYVFDARRAGRQ